MLAISQVDGNVAAKPTPGPTCLPSQLGNLCGIYSGGCKHCPSTFSPFGAEAAKGRALTGRSASS